eukprot:SAG11_NODE_9488_length_907_cov_1.280941_1_plen_122_part_10
MKKRSPAEELALRRKQLQRRQHRRNSVSSSVSSASALGHSEHILDSTAPMRIVATAMPDEAPDVKTAKERAARMAQAELELEKKARAEAEHRAAEMALRALEVCFASQRAYPAGQASLHMLG